MTAPILYCGDTNLESAASYLTGLMTYFGWDFDYVPSPQKMAREVVEAPRSLLILSDYPSTQFDPKLQEVARRHVETGMGLLMIGGWESFHGLGGDWDGTPIGKLLPVEISPADDRVNFDQPALLHPTDWKNEFWNLPWFERPPAIGGLNRFLAKPDADVLLTATPFSPRYAVATGTVDWPVAGSNFPALVTGVFGSGRTAAFASDVAPHWVGGFVDWGASRVSAQAPGASAIEVGSDYAQFWKHLLAFVGKLE